MTEARSWGLQCIKASLAQYRQLMAPGTGLLVTQVALNDTTVVLVSTPGGERPESVIVEIKLPFSLPSLFITQR